MYNRWQVFKCFMKDHSFVAGVLFALTGINVFLGIIALCEPKAITLLMHSIGGELIVFLMMYGMMQSRVRRSKNPYFQLFRTAIEKGILESVIDLTREDIDKVHTGSVGYSDFKMSAFKVKDSPLHVIAWEDYERRVLTICVRNPVERRYGVRILERPSIDTGLTEFEKTYLWWIYAGRNDSIYEKIAVEKQDETAKARKAEIRKLLNIE